MADLILQTRGLEFAYPGGHPTSGSDGAAGSLALRGADVEIPRGTRLALLGANGAGKTTLLLHLNGMLRPSRGNVLIEGRGADYSRGGLLKWRQRVGLVFQEPDDQLFAASVQQDVSFGPLNLGLSEGEVRRRVQEALAAMGISELAESPVHALSFGQKKRAAIAGVLAMRPEVLILDEPTAGLDPQGVKHLLEILESLHASGATIVISTHDVDLAYCWADAVAILAHGRIVAQGPPQLAMQDETEMHTARLRVPWVLAFAALLQQDGRQGNPSSTPRTFEELLEHLRQRGLPKTPNADT